MPAKIDLTGRKFYLLQVVSEAGRNKHKKLQWNCKCDCGSEIVVDGGSLRSGLTHSCGCKKIANNKARSTHSMTKTPEHKAWVQMKTRCYNKKTPNFYNYGGRGIRVSPEWRKSFLTFLSDMGPRPSSKHSIERKNTNGNYCKENCLWATIGEQRINTRKCKLWTIDGYTFKSSREAANFFRVDSATINRWCNGYFSYGKNRPPKENCFSILKYQDK